MTTALFTEAQLIYFDHDIMTIIRKIKNHKQRTDINRIYKKIIKIPAYLMMFPKNFLTFELKTFLKMVELEISLIEAIPHLL